MRSDSGFVERETGAIIAMAKSCGLRNRHRRLSDQSTRGRRPITLLELRQNRAAICSWLGRRPSSFQLYLKVVFLPPLAVLVCLVVARRVLHAPSTLSPTTFFQLNTTKTHKNVLRYQGHCPRRLRPGRTRCSLRT